MSEQRRVLVIYFIFNIACVLPHAILIAYLLSKGISIGDLSIIQISFMLARITLELPSGMLSDRWSRRNTFILGTSLILIAYTLIPVAMSIYSLSAIWFLYGTGTACISGTIENDLLLQLKDVENSEEKIANFNTLFHQTFYFSSLIGGISGSFIFNILGDRMYYLSALLFTIAIILSLTYRQSGTVISDSQPSVKGAISEIKTNHNLVYLMIIAIGLSIFTTIFYFYWQVLLEDKHFSLISFGLFYGLFQLIAILAGKLYKAIFLKINKLLKYIYLLLIIMLFGVVYTNNMIFIFSFSGLLIAYHLISYHSMALYRIELKPDNISSMTSLVGVIESIARIVAFIIIAAISFLPITAIYAVMISIFIILSLFGLLKYKSSTTK